MEPEDVTHGSKHMSLFTYLRQRKTLVYFLVVCYQIFSTQIVLYGLTLMAQALPGDFFLSYFILTCLDIPGTLMAMFILFYVGRRIPMCLLNLTTTIFLGLAALFSARPDLVTVGDPQVLVTIFSCIAKFVGAAAWCVVLVYAQEIFPTNIRSSGVGAVAGVGFLGLFIAPLAVTLSRVDPYIPTAAFAGLMFVAVFTALLGPETRGRVLPTTVEEVLSWGYSLTEEDKKKARLHKEKMDEAKRKILAYRSGKSINGKFPKPYTVGGAVNPGYDPSEYVNGRDEKTAL